jgi:hypothetical protein
MLSPNDQFWLTEVPDRWNSSHLSSTNEMIPLIETVIAQMASLGFSEKDIFGMRLALCIAKGSWESACVRTPAVRVD